jgi:hypothetical protein
MDNGVTKEIRIVTGLEDSLLDPEFISRTST